MATQAERRILHITTDNLENLNDTQIAFEDFRDEAGLSYFGGAFGGRYDNNTSSWGTNISRFARYNSSPVFKNLVFDNDPTQASDAIITLTTTTEMTANHSGESSPATNQPTTDNIGARANRSVNIGFQAGQLDSGGNGWGGVNIGERAGHLSNNYDSVIMGLNAGIGASASYSVLIGNGAGGNTTSYHSIMMGTNTKAEGSENVAIGQWITLNGGKSVAIGRGTCFGSGNTTNSVVIGNEARYWADGPSWKDVIIGYQAGFQNDVTSYNNVYVGTEAATSGNSIYTVAIGTHAGSRTQNNTTALGNVFIGWEAGDQVTPVKNPYRDDFNVLDGLTNVEHNGFNVGIGGLALEGVRGATNVGIGYGAGGMSQGDNFQNISIGTWAGQRSTGYDKISIGTNAGFNLVGDRTVMIGRHTGFTSQFSAGLSAEQLGTGTTASFELGDTPAPQYLVPMVTAIGNARMKGLLLSGNFEEGWIWANQLFGMAPLDQGWVDSYGGVVRKGHMVYNNTLNTPQYYDGTSWQSMSGGATTFSSLTDTPVSYSGNSYSVPAVNSGQTGLVFTGLAASSSEVVVKNSAIFKIATNVGNTSLLSMRSISPGGGFPNKRIIKGHGNSNDILAIANDGVIEYSSRNEGKKHAWGINTNASSDGEPSITNKVIEFEVNSANGFIELPDTTTADITGHSSRRIVPTVEWCEDYLIAIKDDTSTNANTSVTLDYSNGDFQEYTSTYTGATTVTINTPTNMNVGNAMVVIYNKSSTNHKVQVTMNAATKDLIGASDTGSYIFTITRVTGKYIVTQASPTLIS